MNNTASIMSGDSYGIILNTEDYCTIYPNVSDGEPNDYGIMFYAQFRIRPKNSVRWATLLLRLLAIIIIPANITSTNNTAAAK